MATKEEVFSKVQLALVDALGVDEDEVTPQAKLVGDLGAESIDFLDIVFRLEKAFDIKIPRGELFPEDILTSTQYVQNGRVTPEGLTQLKARMPFADLTAFERQPRRAGLRQPAHRQRHVPLRRKQSRRVAAGSPRFCPGTCRLTNHQLRITKQDALVLDRPVYRVRERAPCHGDQERVAGGRPSARPFSRRADDAQPAGHRGHGPDRRPAGGRA